MRRRGSERGVALVVVIWGLALIGTAAVAITLATHGQASTARNAVFHAEARLAAEGGVQLGLRRLLAGLAAGARFDGTGFEWRTERYGVSISIQDEEGKIDLNEAPVELLQGLLMQGGAAPAEALTLACRIAERRGFRPSPCPEERGRLPVEPSVFAALEELRHLDGMSDALYGKISQHLTVYSGSAQLDPTVASREALLAVPTLSEAGVEQFLLSRRLSGNEAVEMLRDGRWFTRSSGQTFTVAAEAARPGGARHRAEAVVRLTARRDKPYAVLAWRQPPSGW